MCHDLKVVGSILATPVHFKRKDSNPGPLSLTMKTPTYLPCIEPIPDSFCFPQVDFSLLLEAEAENQVAAAVQQFSIFKLTKFDLEIKRWEAFSRDSYQVQAAAVAQSVKRPILRSR